MKKQPWMDGIELAEFADVMPLRSVRISPELVFENARDAFDRAVPADAKIFADSPNGYMHMGPDGNDIGWYIVVSSSEFEPIPMNALLPWHDKEIVP